MNAPVVAIACLLLSGLTQPVTPASDSDYVRSGQDALRAQADLPWYDPETDGLGRVDVDPNPDDAQRRSDWGGEMTTTATRRMTMPTFFGQFLQVLAWIALGTLLLGLVWLLVWAAQRMDGGKPSEAEVTKMEIKSARLEDLPVSVSPSEHDLLAAARACYEAGNFDQAIIFAYAYQLVELDRRHLVQLSKGKTNRQYLRELSRQPRLQAILRQTMLAFEDVFFGHHSLSSSRFQQCWDNLDEFHQRLEQPA
jgi:hypothetical protein